MTLRNIYFGRIANASGARGFFGEGYPFHKWWKLIGMTWEKTTFVAKTTTLKARPGNMSLANDRITPRELFPKCIYVDPLKGIVLNAVGLSGPGADFLLSQGRWQKRTEPFFISFMSLGADKAERLQELRAFVALFKHFLPGFLAPVGLELNFSCPNVGLHLDGLFNEIGESLEIANELDIPLVVKLNPTVSAGFLIDIARIPECDAIAPTNTVPWGQLSEKIDWQKLFGSEESPLIKRGIPQPGGLSGPIVFPIVADLINQCKQGGISKPIIGGNGIQSGEYAAMMFDVFRADAIQIGCVGVVRPWRMREIIATAHGYRPQRK